MAKIEAIKAGIADYLDNEFMPLVPNNVGAKKWGISIVITMIINKLDVISNNLSENWFMSSSGIIKEGNVDIDYVVTTAVDLIPQEGIIINIPMIGDTKVTSDDVYKLYDYINRRDNKGADLNGNRNNTQIQNYGDNNKSSK